MQGNSWTRNISRLNLAGGRDDFTVVIEPESTVGDLARNLSLDPDKLTIDGVSHPQTSLLADINLVDGQELSVLVEDKPAKQAEVSLVQIAGLSSGGTLPLGFGEFHFGHSTDDVEMLTAGDVESTAFTLRVSPTGEPTVGPGLSQVLVDGYSLERPTLLGGRTIDSGTAMFTAESPELAIDITDEDPPRVINRRERNLPKPPSEKVETPEIVALDNNEPRMPRLLILIAAVAGITLAVGVNRIFWFFVAIAPILIFGLWLDKVHLIRRQAASRPDPDAEPRAEFARSLDQLRNSVAMHRRNAFPGPAELKQAAKRRNQTLWSRRSTDHDFAHVALAMASLEWKPTVKLSGPAENVLGPVLSASPGLTSIPIPVDFTRGSVALVGSRTSTLACARQAIMALAVLSPPSEVSIGADLAEELRLDWDWLKWLPHLSANPTRQDSSLNLVLVDGVEPPPVPDPRDGTAFTVPTFLIVAKSESDIAVPCATKVTIDAEGRVEIVDNVERPALSRPLAIGVSPVVATTTARSLAGCSDPESPPSQKPTPKFASQDPIQAFNFNQITPEQELKS